ncbi:MAG: FAD-binding protein [Candidatus Hydrogenedens sp.]|jgi:FAD/FMN-containing dehydrogenase/Fe-S oxidoreductase|nr:FAD-binding protein [Candidatus Hydrogenedens sp.]
MTRLEKIQRECRCPVFLDDFTRQLYATDASIYQCMPRAVAFPRTAPETAELMAAAAAEEIPIIPRGAGSGLAGGAIGDALILDMSRHNQFIADFNEEARTIRVGAGTVLDALNEYVQSSGLTFGADVATSSRATVGGMIANNSSGARAPLYGITLDHVDSLELITADGKIHTLSAGSEDMKERLEVIQGKVIDSRREIETRFHREICKRWPGYGLDRYLRSILAEAANPAQLVGGSEGTLCTVFSATLRLVPLPPGTGLILLFFDRVQDAMEASASLLDLEPASIEHMDRLLFDQTRDNRNFEKARALLELDEKPCEGILLVEFYDHIEDKLEEVKKRGLGQRHLLCATEEEKALVWHLRKAGLSLLTGCAGAAKPTAGIEDVAVPPAQLPRYVESLRSVVERLGLKASFYGHAAAGLLHVRPVLDLRSRKDIEAFRALAEEVSALTLEFKGSLTAEHGVGINRTEFMTEHIGTELLKIMEEVKEIFDPRGLMNPGKVLDTGRWRIDKDLRMGDGYALPVPFEPLLLFQAKDHSFTGNLEQCNGCGGCRKEPPVMCPTFQAAGDEALSTRGRANIIRAVLEGRLDSDKAPLLSESLESALSNCLSCKACTSECPSNVNMALLKAELLHARHRKHGVPFYARLLSRVDLLGALGSAFPRLTNASFSFPPFRWLLQRLVHIAQERSLPPYALQRFDRWFRKEGLEKKTAHRGTILLWDDCFVRHNEPHIGRAAVRVLEKAGYSPRLVEGHACCGRPAFSMGRLDVARKFGNKNLRLLRETEGPILFLEPSCYAMFREEYRELGLEGAQEVAERAVLFEQFIEQLLQKEPDALPIKRLPYGLAIHAHCHAKAQADTSIHTLLAQRLTGARASMLNSGCCGMAGAFGVLEDKYALSLAVAEPLLAMIDALPEDTAVISSGASCRHQLTDLSSRPPLHFAEVLDLALSDCAD